MKRVLIALVALSALSVGAGQASAAVACTPTMYLQDGRPLTAALINPPAALVPENLDATGCDIGIYYSQGTNTLTDKNVFGATYYGVLSNGSGTVTNFSHGSAYDIGNHPHDGTQHGVAIAYRNGAGGQVDNSQLFDYQKGGVVADGAGTQVTVLSNVVRGLGPVDFIAQNGVQFSNGATGSINNNVIEDHDYTGCSKEAAKATGCTPYVAAGILLVSVDPTSVDTKNNTFRDDQVNLLNASSQ